MQNNILVDIKKIEVALRNTKPLTGALASLLYDSAMQNFVEQGRPKWKGLAKATIKARTRANKWPGHILQVSGQLKNSIVKFNDERNARVQTNKIYAPVHQFGATITQHPRTALYKHNRGKRGKFTKGTTRGRGATYGKRTITIPPRPFFGLTPQEKGRVDKIISAFVLAHKS